MTNDNNKPMITISAEDFWNELKEIKKSNTEESHKIREKISTMDTNNQLGHAEIISHQKQTNGKVRMNRKLIYGIISVSLPLISLIITLLFNHINAG